MEAISGLGEEPEGEWEEQLCYFASSLGNPTATQLRAVNICLSNEHFVESLKKTEGKDRDERKAEVEVWPSVVRLAELALAVYEEGGRLGGAEGQAGWELLCTASSPHWTDGYFGAAYLNRHQQQLVLAHRGSVLGDPGSWNTNVQSIINNKISERLNSAITFSERIIAAMDECEDSGIRFQLSMTGHSLGGWLAQVAAFSVKYLERNEEGITKMKSGRGGYHVRTVVFDSPGSDPMLSKLVKDLDLRYNVTMDLGRLDIASFLSAPNRINTRNSHVGEVFRIMTDLSTMTSLDKHTPKYNDFTHRMSKIAEALHKASKVWRVLDWPMSHGLLGGPEYSGLFARATHENEYNPPAEEGRPNRDHYYTREVAEDSCSLRVFSDRELDLLEAFITLKRSDQPLVEMNWFTSRIGLKDRISDLFTDTTCNYKKGMLKCTSKESLDRVVKFIKILQRWWGDEAEGAVQRQMKLVPSAGEAMWLQESRRVLDCFPERVLGLRDVIGLRPFLEAPDERVLVLAATDTAFECYRVHCLLQQMNSESPGDSILIYLREESKLFLEWEQLKSLQRFTNIEGILTSEVAANRLLVLYYKNRAFKTQEDEYLLNSLFESCNKCAIKKLILVLADKSDIHLHVEDSFPNILKKSVDDLKFSDLPTEARELIVTRRFISVNSELLSTTHTSIRDMLRSEGVNEATIVSDLLDGPKLKELVTNDQLMVNLDGYLPDFHAMDVTYTIVNREINMSELKGFLGEQSRPYLVVSGLSQEARRSSEWSELTELVGELMEVTELGEEAGAALFGQACRQREDRTVVWAQLAAGKLHLKRVYDLDLYIKRTFISKIEIDIKKLEKNITELNHRDMYVFQNIENRVSVERLLDLSNAETRGRVVIDSGDQFRPDNEKPTHFLEIEGIGTEKQRVVWKSSDMSLNGLRPVASYSTDPRDALGEQELSAALSQRKPVLLVGEPGMGKSTSLTAVSRLILDSWLVRIDLRHYQTRIRNLTFDLNYEDVVNFLLPEQSERFKVKLFEYVLKSRVSKQVCILFDGFDEIQEEYSGHVIKKCAQEKMVNLLKFLVNETSANVFVTTRPFPCKLLENELSVFATRFSTIDSKQQCQFSAKFWRLHLAGGLGEGSLQRYSEALLEGAHGLLGGDIAAFMSVPLQMRMLTEGFLPVVRRLRANPPTDREQTLADAFRCGSVHDLYEIFIKAKYNIYLGEKSNISPHLTTVNKGWMEDAISKIHRKLGFIQLFPENTDFLENFKTTKEELIELNRIGLIQLGGDWVWEFIHPTFAEYHVAGLFWRILWRGWDSRLGADLELLMTVVLLEESFKVVRIFINDQLRKHSPTWTERAQNRIFSDIKRLWREKSRKFFDNDYQTALHVAVMERNESIVQFLLMVLQSEKTSGGGQGISEFANFVAARDRRGAAALLLAGRGQDAAPVCAFLAGLEACAPQDARYVLHSSIYRSSKIDRVVESFLTLLHSVQGPADLENIISNQNDKCKAIQDFLEAAESGDTKYLEQSLRPTEDEAVRRSSLLASAESGATGLHLAAREGRAAAVNTLLRHGAPPDLVDREGQTPLMHIAIYKNDDNSQMTIAKDLIESGASPDHRDINGMSVLAWSARNNNLTLSEYLIQTCGADWTVPDKNRISPFLHAAKQGHLETVELLLGLGAPLDGEDLFGMTALGWAARGGQRPVAERLVAAGADVNARDRYGVSVLQVAIKAARWDLVDFLLEQDVRVRDSSFRGDTALGRAVRAGRWDLVRRLLLKGAEPVGSFTAKQQARLSSIVREIQNTSR